MDGSAGGAEDAEQKGGLPILPFGSRKAWEVWIEEHHASSGGLWIKFAKNGSGVGTVSYAEALEVALRYGWIDGQKASFDGAVEGKPQEGHGTSRAGRDETRRPAGGRASQGRR